MPRGGRRNGTPGKAYSNRVDLNAAKGPIAVNAPTGQAYGARAEQIAAQRAIPIARPATDTLPTGPSAAGPAAPPTAAAGPAPMAPIPLDADSTRPNEPVTAGVPVGAGPGPEVLGLPDENGVEDLAMYLPLLEMIASRPGASVQTRNFVRRLRGAAPVR